MKTRNTSIALCLVALAGNLGARAEDGRWDEQFFSPGFLGGVSGPFVRALATAFTPSGDLICAGTFGNVANLPGTRNLARWDGKSWNSVGGGVPGVSSAVYAVATRGQEIIVGGVFTSVGGQQITNLATWDGTSWKALGGGVTGGSVRALAVRDGVVFVGGLFTRAGSNDVHYVAAWDGTNWNNLGAGVSALAPSEFALPVQSLLVANDSVYVGGKFYAAGGTPATNLARWTGTGWESVGVGAENGVNGNVSAMTVDASGRLYVAGQNSRAGTTRVRSVAVWNGGQWSNLGEGVTGNGTVATMVIRGSDLIVGGDFDTAGTNSVRGLARWDGSRWSPLTNSVDLPTTFAFDGSRLFICGLLTNLISRQVYGLLLIDESGTEKIVGTGLGGNGPGIRSIWTDEGKLWVSGFFERGLAVARWNGNNWMQPGNGLYAATFLGGSVEQFLTFRGNTYAAGLIGVPSMSGYSGIARLEGETWRTVGVGSPGNGLALNSSGPNLYLGHSDGIARWTGSTWSNVGQGLQGAVNAIAFLGPDLYAGGNFTNSGSTSLRNIAKWDGTNWTPVGLGANGTVWTIESHRNRLFVGGEFTEVGGVPCARVAQWVNGSWGSLGSGFSRGIHETLPDTNDSYTAVYRLTVAPDGTLFAGGNFTASGTNTANFAAVWDGTDWSAVGGGMNHWVRDMNCDGQSLYLCGDFTKAGSTFSSRMARWILPGDLLNVVGSAPETISQNTDLTYALKVKNVGAISAHGVELRMPLPSATRFLEASHGGLITEGQVRWTIGQMAAGAESLVYATVVVEAGQPLIVLRDYFVSAGAKTFHGPAIHTGIRGAGDPMSIVALPMADDGPFLLRIGGPPGNVFEVQSSSDFAQWKGVATNIFTGYITEIQVPIGNWERQFYRVLRRP